MIWLTEQQITLKWRSSNWRHRYVSFDWHRCDSLVHGSWVCADSSSRTDALSCHWCILWGLPSACDRWINVCNPPPISHACMHAMTSKKTREPRVQSDEGHDLVGNSVCRQKWLWDKSRHELAAVTRQQMLAAMSLPFCTLHRVCLTIGRIVDDQ